MHTANKAIKIQLMTDIRCKADHFVVRIR